MKRFSVALTAATMILTLAACGSSSSTSSTAAAGTGTSASRQQARLALAQCLRAHGLNVADPGAGGAGPGGGGGGIFRSLQNVPQAQLQSVRQACSSQFSAAFPRLNMSPAQQAQLRSQLVKFAQCMRSHGVNMADPQVGGGTGGFGFRRAFGSVDRNSPAFRTALTACQKVSPGFGRGRAGAPAGPGA